MDKKSEEFKAFKMNKQNQVEISADIFVIPNEAPSINDFLDSGRNKWRERFKEVAELNGLPMPTDDDPLIQLWWTDRDKIEGYCDNLVRHTFAFEDTEGNILFGCIEMEFFPKMWLGYKEDETFDIILPVTTRKKNFLIDHDKKNYAKLNVRLKQKNYRYAWVGTFEDAVEKVSR